MSSTTVQIGNPEYVRHKCDQLLCLVDLTCRCLAPHTA